MFRDLRPRRVGEPRRRSEREHATLSLGRAAGELAEPDRHVASQNVRAGVGLDDDHLMAVSMSGRRQQADPGNTSSSPSCSTYVAPSKSTHSRIV